MTEQNFIERRESSWKEFSKLITGNKNELKKGASSFIIKFREISQDLNTAKACGFDPAIIDRLNTLVNEGNQILYAQHELPVKSQAQFLLRTFPQKIRSHWRGILAVTFIFYGIDIFFTLLCLRFPNIPEDLISSQILNQYESMYDPESLHFLRARNVSNDADMFGFYIYNNISLAFRMFAGGIFAGIGSLVLLCFNAGFLGLVQGHIFNAGYGENLFSFIIAHGAFELTAIIFCAYSGLLLGYRFFVTGGLSRGASIKKAGKDALPIVAGSTIMLVIAAAIEAFWSSKYQLPIALRIAVGISMWILLLLYFLFAGRNSEAEKSSK